MRFIILTFLTVLMSCSNSRTDNQSANEDATTMIAANDPIDSVSTEPIPQTEFRELTIIDSLKLRADSLDLQ